LAVSPPTVVPTVSSALPVPTPVAAPVAQNSTHEVVPVVEEEEKEITTKDTSTGLEKKEKVKVPVTKNKVVPKGSLPASAPVAAPVEIPEAQTPVA
jgi:hypothetical protein